MTDDLERVKSVLADRYRIERELGRGGMATVFLAYDVRQDRLVALKLLSPELSHLHGTERFLQEIALTAKLQHPNILPLFDSGEADGRLWYVMPYVQGESLRRRLEREGPMPLAEAGQLVREVADALAHAHRAGIIHRDVKPENILLSEGHALLADFGIARVGPGPAPPQQPEAEELPADSWLTQAGSLLGTLSYMSPEQLTGEGEPTATSDVYALGCVLYELLTGRTLTSGTAAGQLLAQKLEAAAPITGVPQKLADVVRRAVSPDPARRYATAAEFGEAVGEALELESATGRAVRKSARRNLAAAVLAGIALLAVSGFAVRAIHDRGVREQAARDVQRVRLLADSGDYLAGYELASKLEKVIPGDSGLAAVWPLISVLDTLRSEPSGARVYEKLWVLPGPTLPGRWEPEWRFLGVTPLDGVRLVASPFCRRYRIEKEGFAPVELIAGRHLLPFDLSRLMARIDTIEPLRLDSVGSLPPGMLRAAGFVAGRGAPDSIVLGEYLVDRLEVSNTQYQVFVDSGGYRRPELWRHAFLEDGRQLSWQEAMALLVDRTGRPGPATWLDGRYPAGQGDLPVGGISWYEAEAYAAFTGKSLPTVSHWFHASQLDELGYLIEPISNLNGAGPQPVGRSDAIGAFGAADMIGNVREWVYNRDGAAHWILGGGWDDLSLPGYGSLPPFDRAPQNGVRLFSYGSDSAALARARAPRDTRPLRDYTRERPVGAAEFRGILRLYQYDRTPLEARVESVDTTDNWVRERVTFTPAYYGERMILYLYLPKTGRPPYQTVAVFPGTGALQKNASPDFWSFLIGPLLASGRAVALPAYRGTFDRDTIEFGWSGNRWLRPPAFVRDMTIAWSKDLQRSVDYLVTRPQIDSTRLGYYGFSWGGYVAPIMLATELRLRVAVVYVAGLRGELTTPEADELNFLPRVTVPFKMIGGRYDQIFHLETQQKPYLNLLGTPPGQREHYVAATGHGVPEADVTRETLLWFDRWLGKVERKP